MLPLTDLGQEVSVMAYSELIKSFDRIRDYMRDFYVYGFKSRTEYDAKSARSYDNERRRVESWLGEYMSFTQDPAGKRVFLSVDSRRIPSNPLYKAFKAKSFTDRDITLHFYILDILADGAGRTAGQIMDIITERYLSAFDCALSIDESTVRKKLREYEELGLLQSEKNGKRVEYRRADDPQIDLSGWADAVAFFSEDAPLGVIGSFLLDKLETVPRVFNFKHHYILHALDSGVLYQLLSAIGERRAVELTLKSPRNGREYVRTVCPLRIYSSTQTGRQYVLGYHYQGKRMAFYRVDAVRRVGILNVEKKIDVYEGYYAKFRENLWGVSVGAEHELEHIEMTLRVEPGEGHIVQRLEREKRGGTIEVLDGHTYRFSADVYDAYEMLPWLRTFTGRIVELQCSNQSVVDTFYADLEQMMRQYGGDGHAL